MRSPLLRCFRGGKGLRAAVGGNARIVWVGALSFEERCTASLEVFEKAKIPIAGLVAIDYSTSVRPVSEAERIRERHWEKVQRLADATSCDGVDRLPVAPYAFQDLHLALDSIHERESACTLVFDMSCFTRVHTMALASWLTEANNVGEWVAAYSVPANYLPLGGGGADPAWRDIIVAPLAESADLFNEAKSRGLVLPGHEGDRLIVSLSEIEPSGGIIIQADSPGRPDFHAVTARNNQAVVRQMLRRSAKKWIRRTVPVPDLNLLYQCVAEQVKAAKEGKAPVILFPFGPKSMAFAMALQLIRQYAESSWFVYPVPAQYVAEYSEGVEETLWMCPSNRPKVQGRSA